MGGRARWPLWCVVFDSAPRLSAVSSSPFPTVRLVFYFSVCSWGLNSECLPGSNHHVAASRRVEKVV